MMRKRDTLTLKSQGAEMMSKQSHDKHKAVLMRGTGEGEWHCENIGCLI